MFVDNGTGKLGIRLVNPNCNEEDAIKEIISAVDGLHSISSQIFSALATRIREQREQVSELDKRIEGAKDKIQRIKGAQKGIRIVSPAKYPVGDEDGPILKPLVIVPKKKEDEEEVGIVLPQRRKDVPRRFDPPVKHTDDLLACYHVREPSIPPLSNEMQTPGLGWPPEGIQLVDSLLLFNTAENPYRSYRLPSKLERHRPIPRPLRRDDSMFGTSQQQGLTEVEDEDEDEEAKDGVDDFFYSPSNFSVPDINVPDQLPDLPGIVDDFDWTAQIDNSQSFFPLGKDISPATSPRNAKKAERQEEVEKTNNKKQVDNTSQPAKSSTNEASKIAKPPKVEERSTPSSSSGIPPPPPPPMFAPIPPPAPPPSSTPVASSDDMRSSLMAAIRAAGGSSKATLRSTQEIKYEAKRKKQQEEKEKAETAAGGGGDMMADLKNTLAMRRKGISGIREAPKATAAPSMPGMGGIMQTLASTVPTMEKSSDSLGFGDNSDDEEDEDGWD